jgi:hypothetical protein
MGELVEKVSTVEVPKGTGIDGFFAALKKILLRPRVQKIEINPQGKITYRFFAREEDPQQAEVDFDQILPYAIARNGEVVEISSPDTNAAVAVAQLFTNVADDQLFPVAFAMGTQSTVWRWFERTTGLKARNREAFFGLQVFPDRFIPDDTLMLCAAYGRTSSLLDTRKTYKLTVPPEPPSIEVVQ